MNFSLTKVRKILLLIAIFSIAMGFLEAIVVVYLRELYYPNGFNFPMKLIPNKIYLTEILREISTIIMLLTIGNLSGKSKLQKFVYFLFAFAVWDIFYYIALKLLLNWPNSFFTWDILFLIPIPWLSPVFAPIICSFGMVMLSIYVLGFDSNEEFHFTRLEWFIIIFGTIVIFFTLIWDYTLLIISGGFLSQFFSLMDNKEFLKVSLNYVPVKFNWVLFFAGCILILSAILKSFIRINTSRETKLNILNKI
jgi:hypothetical protein